jgi:hypothetical protein
MSGRDAARGTYPAKAQAAYVVTLQQVGANVIAIGSGPLAPPPAVG